MAASIGEVDEAERIAVFMQQLDPGGIPAAAPGESAADDEPAASAG
jgi:hypothetical protein